MAFEWLLAKIVVDKPGQNVNEFTQLFGAPLSRWPQPLRMYSEWTSRTRRGANTFAFVDGEDRYLGASDNVSALLGNDSKYAFERDAVLGDRGRRVPFLYVVHLQHDEDWPDILEVRSRLTERLQHLLDRAHAAQRLPLTSETRFSSAADSSAFRNTASELKGAANAGRVALLSENGAVQEWLGSPTSQTSAPEGRDAPELLGGSSAGRGGSQLLESKVVVGAAIAGVCLLALAVLAFRT